MSVQTGTETPSTPASRRIGDRVRFRLALWRSQPNPIWVREMRQAARLVRTPVVLMVITLMMTLLMASIGGIMTGTQSPAEAGKTLYHVYFSLAWFVVTLIGPAIAANGIASEREGKTWEAVLLTGMRASEVTRGKFLSAYTSVAMYVVMLAPVGALPFLFGGIAPVEVLAAFLFLFLIALLSVAFGLAISSKMDSLRTALLVTLLVSVFLSTSSFSLFGVAMSHLGHELWPAVDANWPVWLPTAYSRAPFGVDYLVYLVALPLAAVGLPAWLLYEITRANLTSVTDDRSYGVKRWYLVAVVVLVASGAVPIIAAQPDDKPAACIIAMCGYALFIVFSAFLFAGEAIGPSRRVQKKLAGARTLRRLLAPGVTRTAYMQLVGAVAGLVALCAIGIIAVNTAPPPVPLYGSFGGPAPMPPRHDVEGIFVFTCYAVGFAIFVVGLTAFLRARAVTSLVPRVLLLVILFVLTSGPWILAAISGALSGGHHDALYVAAPSPIYAFYALDSLGRPFADEVVTASVTMSCIYAGIGLACLVLASARCRRIIDAHESILADADRRLAEEDERLAAERRAAEDARLAALEVPAGATEGATTDAAET